MFRLLVICFLISLSSVSFAGTCEFNGSGLDQTARQELKIICEQKRAEAFEAGEAVVATNILDPKALSEWGKVAQEFSKAIGIAAKELGQSANDFIKTPLGIITTAVVLWMVLGPQIIGLPILVLTWIVAWRFGKNIFIKGYEERTRNTWRGSKLGQVPVKKPISEFEDSDWVVLIVLTVLVVASNWILLGAVIF